MTHRTRLVIAIMAGMVVAVLAFVAYTRSLDLNADREFGAQAERVRLALATAVGKYGHSKTGQSQLTAISACAFEPSAELAATRLRRAQKRELALRWLQARKEWCTRHLEYGYSNRYVAEIEQ